jgi:hypothetical protein
VHTNGFVGKFNEKSQMERWSSHNIPYKHRPDGTAPGSIPVVGVCGDDGSFGLFKSEEFLEQLI